LLYLALWLWYGVGVTLIGWRISRRFGWRGLIGFIGLSPGSDQFARGPFRLVFH